MLGIFTGTIFDVGMVIVGGILGLLLKNDLMERVGERIFQTFAILVLAIGISSAINLDSIYLILASVIIGVPIGEIIDLDSRISKLGNTIERKANIFRGRYRSRGNVGKAFSQSTMILCIGSMTVMGALQSGMSDTHSMLFTKGILDGITMVTMAMSLGAGVLLGGIPLLLYEGAIVLFADWVSPLMTADVMGAFNAVGGLLLIAIALNLLKITDIKVTNMTPAMFIPFVYEAICLLVK